VNPNTGGKALYSFNIAATGDYIISAKVNCPSGGNNSYFVNIDAEPSTKMIWDIPPTNGLETRLVTWDPIKTPHVWRLTAGTHQLIVRGREADTKLGKIKFSVLPAPPQNLHIQQ
jgi:hypothetical protein